MLDAAVEQSRALGLVSAPAGAGKSMAVATWLAGREDLESLWLHLDDSDNDPVRFWAGVAAGLDVIHAGFEDEFLTTVLAPNTAFSVGALPILVNTLNDGEPLVIVLDDYHVVANPEIHDGLQALVDSLPPQVAVVISTRLDPPLRLGRQRVRGRLVEIRARDLAFSPSEATSFFPDHECVDAQIDQLVERTEGWAAGLALAAVSMRQSADPVSFVADFAGDDRLVVDYLATEFWDALTPEARDIMLATSILDELCGPLVDAVAGIDRGTSWLERVAADNQLVLALDGQRHWYRYHNLLRDLLRAELERTRPDQIEALQRRAVTWFAENGLEEQAIRCALAGGELLDAADLIATEAYRATDRGLMPTVMSWLDQLGDDILTQHLGCAMVQAWRLIFEGRFDEVEPWLATTRRLSDAVDPGDMPFAAEEVDAAEALTCRGLGDVGGALAAAERLMVSSGPDGPSAFVADIVGDCFLWAGRLDDARPLLEWAADECVRIGRHGTACTSRRDLAVLAMEDDDPGQARHHAHWVFDHAEKHHLTEYHHIALAHSVAALTTLDEQRQMAVDHADRGVELARRSKRPTMLAYALAARAQVRLASGEGDLANVDIREARKVLSRCPDPGMVLTVIARREAHLADRTGRVKPTRLSELPEAITPRELTVLRLLPSRLNVPQIAVELNVSPNTVKGHVKAIYRKLGVNERALAVQRARELRLL